jgi:hypothetical protein
VEHGVVEKEIVGKAVLDSEETLDNDVDGDEEEDSLRTCVCEGDSVGTLCPVEELLRFGVAVVKLEVVTDCDADIEGVRTEDIVFCDDRVVEYEASPDRDAADADAEPDRCGESDDESVASCDADAISVTETPALGDRLPDAELDGWSDNVAPILDTVFSIEAEALRLDEDTVRVAGADICADTDAHSVAWPDELGWALKLEVAEIEAAPLVSAEKVALSVATGDPLEQAEEERDDVALVEP